MRAIGNDGRWHEWDELSAEEQQAWMEAMTEADKTVEQRKSIGTVYPATVAEGLLNFQWRRYGIN